MLPDVNADDGHMRKKRVLIGGCGYRQGLAFGIDTLENGVMNSAAEYYRSQSTYEPTPSRPLNSSRGRVEFTDEIFEASERCLNSLFERAVLQYTAVSSFFDRGSKVLPEKRVIDVT
jgi:hypothetical protein